MKPCIIGMIDREIYHTPCKTNENKNCDQLLFLSRVLGGIRSKSMLNDFDRTFCYNDTLSSHVSDTICIVIEDAGAEAAMKSGLPEHINWLVKQISLYAYGELLCTVQYVTDLEIAMKSVINIYNMYIKDHMPLLIDIDTVR